MIPRTDKERILQLEARCADMESELAEYRRMDRAEAVAPDQEDVDAIRRALRSLEPARSGICISRVFWALLSASPRPLSRDRLFAITRDKWSWADEDGARKTIDVQICHLRKVLAKRGFDGVIKTMNGRGWMIEPDDRDAIKTALSL